MRKHSGIALLGLAFLVVWACMPQWALAKGEDRVIGRGDIRLPIGPIGVRCMMTSVTTAKVLQIEKGSPADGKLQVDDVIVGANGKKFAKAIWLELAAAIEASQGDPKLSGKFTLEALRKGRAITAEMKIERLGYFSSTYPFNCPKSDRIYEMACDYLVRVRHSDGTWPHQHGRSGQIYGTAVGGMALLGTGNPKYNDSIRKIAAFMMEQNVGPSAGGSSMWSLTYAGMFLSEYYLAIGGDPRIQEHLRKLYLAIRYAQMAYGGRDGGSLDDPYGGPYYWNHAGQQAENIGSYPHMGVMNANAILTYGLMQRCGIAIDPINLNRTQGLTDTSTVDGGVCYGYRGSAGDGFGRTGLTTIGYHLLNNRPDALKQMTGFLSRSGVDDNVYFRSHYTPMIGQTWGLLGLHLTNPKAFHESMKHFKWSFILNHHYNGGFVRCSNLYAYMYYYPSKKVAPREVWIGGSEFQSLFYALSKKNLAVAGGKVHVMGVDRGKLPPELAKALGLMEQQRFQDAHKAVKSFRADAKTAASAKAMLAFIENRAKMSARAIARLKNADDVYQMSIKLKEHKQRFGDVGGYGAKIAAMTRGLASPKQVKQTAIGRELYGILDRPFDASQKKAAAELKAFVDKHPQSPYANIALSFIDRKRVSESIPESVVSQMEGMKNRGDLYELSRRMHVYRPMFGTNPDYRKQIQEQWRLVSTNDAEVKIGQEWARLRHRLSYDKARRTDKYVEFRKKEITDFLKKYKNSPYAKLAREELKTTSLNWYRTRGSTKDDAVIGLQRMTHLTKLSLSTSSVTNEGIKLLAPLTALTHLDISDTGVRPGVVEHLRPFTKLTHLSLSHMVDSDIEALDKLGLKLVDLSLNRCWRLTDRGMPYVGKWKTLESLNLRATSVTDKGLASLKPLRLKKLILIRLKGNLTDAGLAHVGGMTTLEYLDLSFNPVITDDGLAQLARLKNLKYLDLCGTNITWQAVQKLRKAIGNDALFVKRIN